MVNKNKILSSDNAHKSTKKEVRRERVSLVFFLRRNPQRGFSCFKSYNISKKTVDYKIIN